MEHLEVNLVNCYGINKLEYVFDFKKRKTANKCFAIYAPNGLMKSSFARTFEVISQGNQPKEERYNRPSVCIIKEDENIIDKDIIYVLKAEIDIRAESSAVTNILVNPKQKARYDELLIELDKQKAKLINVFQKDTGIKKSEIESRLLKDNNEQNFFACIDKLNKIQVPEIITDKFKYSIIFDDKALEIYKNEDFLKNANEFNIRYQKLFENSNGLYKKGIFNPTKAEITLNTLDKQGFFESGHKVYLNGQEASLGKAEFENKLKEINAYLDNDEKLQSIRKRLAKNTQTQALISLFESLSTLEIEFLLEKLKPENQLRFKKEIWAYYVQKCDEARNYVQNFKDCEKDIINIQNEASKLTPQWEAAVDLFNERFVNMPFTLSVSNPVKVALGQEPANLIFTFKDGEDEVHWERSEIKTLSQGEKRALYLLNFIFEVEARKINNQKTLFIIDDIADSFDYKNKHAIVQYLDDLNKIDFFYQIILTHNFDLYRTLANNFVHRDNCLMANKLSDSLKLEQAEGIKNYFIGKLKDRVISNDIVLCATIPFTRNIIEYTKGELDKGYLDLTNLLHWKEDTEKITIGDYLNIYNDTFGTAHATDRVEYVKDVIFAKAEELCLSPKIDGLNLENKILLSIAIRLSAERFLIIKIRRLKEYNSYWCNDHNQFGSLMKIISSSNSDISQQTLHILEKVSITVSSNIHLNSFMYEPILDLSIEHLISLYGEVKSLK
ncbi:hypothetical protein RCS94_01405 [Orbaceae bacterium ac157xtp]